jgi:sarcosine oxidase subunit delta
MKIMTCPINGPRLISEFAYAGELKEMPDPTQVSDEQWADYVFNKNGPAGMKREWWCHTASGVWFIAERDTTRDVVVRTYLYKAEVALT